MKKNTSIMVLFTALSILFTSCKKDDAIPALEYRTQGFIKGSLKANTGDGELQENFNYSKYLNGDASQDSFYKIVVEDLTKEDTIRMLNIYRADVNNGGSFFLDLKVNDEGVIETSGTNFEFNFRKETNDKIYYFSSEKEGNSLAFKEFSFDEKSGRAKGNFTIKGSKNSTERPATIEGSFDVVLKKQVINVKDQK